MHCWAWRCKHCLGWFVPRFANLKWESSELGEHLTTPAQARRTAYLVCTACGGAHYDSDKAELNRTGRFVAPGQFVALDGTVIGDAADTSTLSFWVSGLASPFRTFGERAESYLQAVRAGDQGLEPGHVQLAGVHADRVAARPGANAGTAAVAQRLAQP